MSEPRTEAQTGPHQLKFVLDQLISSFTDLLVMAPLVDETYSGQENAKQVIGKIAPLNDLRVRQAIAHALDRGRIVQFNLTGVRFKVEVQEAHDDRPRALRLGTHCEPLGRERHRRARGRPHRRQAVAETDPET